MSINCQTINKRQNWRQVNKKQDKSKKVKISKLIHVLITTFIMGIDYFIAGPEMEAHRAASAKTALIMGNNYSDIFTGIGCF